MSNYANSAGMPIGLGMALAQNIEAMNYFSSLPADEREKIIGRAQSIQSKEEMQAYVQSFSVTGVILR